MGFGDYDAARRMRDVLIPMMEGVVTRMRPEPRIGQVVDFNPNPMFAALAATPSLTCRVLFPGSESPMAVKYSPALSPRKNGDIVRVGGRPGNYYITDVISSAAYNKELDPRVETLEARVPSLFSTKSTSSANIATGDITVVGGWSGSSWSESQFCTNVAAGGSPAGTITMLRDGLVSINASVSFVGNATGRRAVMIYVNDALARRTDVGASTNTQMTLEAVHYASLIEGDQINVRVLQSSGADLALANTVGHDFQVMLHP